MGSGVAPIERPPTTSHVSQYNVFLYLPLFGRDFSVKLHPRPLDPHLGIRVDLGVENGSNRNVDPTFLFEFYTHYRPIKRRLGTIYNAADDRQTDRAIGTGRLCYSIGGLNILWYFPCSVPHYLFNVEHAEDHWNHRNNSLVCAGETPSRPASLNDV